MEAPSGSDRRHRDEEPEPVVFTIGHGARSADELTHALGAAGIRRLVDVRTAPGSRKHPQFGRDALARTLESERIRYEWRRDMGGWRRARPDSPHTALRSPGFRGYADHMDTDEFRAALDWLIETSRREPTAVMCAETLWWRCHRRMLADALLTRGCRVLHLLPRGRVDPHRLSRSAREVDGRLRYDVAASEPPLRE